MQDPFGVRTAGRLRVACQILHLDRLDHGTLIDLVTIEPCERQGRNIPPGTALALGFDYEPSRVAQQELETLLVKWENEGTVLDVDVHDAATGVCYQFSSGDHQLVLLVEERPGAA